MRLKLFAAALPIALAGCVSTLTVGQATVLLTLNESMMAIASRNPERMRPLLRPYGTFTVMEENADGTRRLSSGDWDAFLKSMGPGPEKYEERLNDIKIRLDGTVAVVWAPYTFFVDGRVRHCGINHFHLVLDQAEWKIQNITWTQRINGCQTK